MKVISWCTGRYLYKLAYNTVLWCLCTVLTDTKSPFWESTDIISVQGQNQCSAKPVCTVVQLASQREWYLISPGPNWGRSWQTNGFAVSRMFSGGAGWAEIQRCCLWVAASAKHNKTLWGMNQTQSDRNTKAHMLTHSVNFKISVLFAHSFFSHPTHLHLLRPSVSLYHWLPVLGLSL